MLSWLVSNAWAWKTLGICLAVSCLCMACASWRKLSRVVVFATGIIAFLMVFALIVVLARTPVLV